MCAAYTNVIEWGMGNVYQLFLRKSQFVAKE